MTDPLVAPAELKELITMSDPKTYGDLKRLVAKTPRGDWPSRVNASLTRSQALDILSAALNTYPDDQAIAETLRGDLMTRNVLRECRSRA